MDRRSSPAAALWWTICKSIRSLRIWWGDKRKDQRRPARTPGPMRRDVNCDTRQPTRRGEKTPPPINNVSGYGSLRSRAFAGTTRLTSRNPDRHVRQAFQLAQQHVALHHRADILRRAGIDDVAGLQLERFGQFCDLLRHAPDHFVQIGVLPHRAVDGQRDRALGEVSCFRSRMDRPEYRGMIKTFADFPRLLFGGHAVL